MVGTGAGFVKDGEPSRRDGGEGTMMQNISASAIRKPIPRDRPLHPADLRGRCSASRSSASTSSRTSTSRYVTVTRDQIRARRRPSSRRRSRASSRTRSPRSATWRTSPPRCQDGVSATIGGVRVRQEHRPRGQRRARRGDAGAQRPAGRASNEPVITRIDHLGRADADLHGQGRGQRSAAELSWFVDNEIAKTLLTVPGVGQVKRVGGVDREIRVALAAASASPRYGITAAEVSRQLRAINVRTCPAARRAVRPQEQSIRTLGGGAERRHAARDADHAARTGARCACRTSARCEDVRRPGAGRLRQRRARWSRSRCCAAVGSSSVDVARERRRGGRRSSRPTHPAIELKLFTLDGRVHARSRTTRRSRRCGSARCSRWSWCWLVPARLARDADLGGGACRCRVIPTFFFMSWLRLHAQPDHPAGPVAGGRHPGGRRDRRGREHRAPHPHGQERRCRRRSTRPTRSAWRWWPPRSRSSRCSSR